MLSSNTVHDEEEHDEDGRRRGTAAKSWAEEDGVGVVVVGASVSSDMLVGCDEDVSRAFRQQWGPHGCASAAGGGSGLGRACGFIWSPPVCRVGLSYIVLYSITKKKKPTMSAASINIAAAAKCTSQCTYGIPYILLLPS